MWVCHHLLSTFTPYENLALTQQEHAFLSLQKMFKKKKKISFSKSMENFPALFSFRRTRGRKVLWDWLLKKELFGLRLHFRVTFYFYLWSEPLLLNKPSINCLDDEYDYDGKRNNFVFVNNLETVPKTDPSIQAKRQNWFISWPFTTALSSFSEMLRRKFTMKSYSSWWATGIKDFPIHLCEFG